MKTARAAYRALRMRKLIKLGQLTQKELDDYAKCLDNPDYLRQDIEYCGVKIDGEVITSGGFTGPFYKDVAVRLATRGWDDRVYRFLCQQRGYADVSIDERMMGTEIYCNAQRQLNEHLRELASMNVQLVKQPKPVNHKIHIRLPQRIRREHSPNILLRPPVHQELPPLNQEWLDLWNQLMSPEEIEWVGSDKIKVPVKHDRVYGRIEHPSYGTYGTMEYNIKEDFHCTCRNSKDCKTATASVALAKPLPCFLPRWNRRDPMTLAFGALGRIGREPVPKADINYPMMEGYIDRAVNFIINKLEDEGLHPRHLTPYDSWSWLSQTHFPAKKTQKYAEAFAAVCRPDGFLPAEQFSNIHSAFGKNECYLAADKAQRLILAGDYQMAAVLAPACDILGDYFFSLEYTSKKIPEVLRPQIALDRFNGPVILNDMSAFEGSITGYIKDHIEHKILRHFFPNIDPWLQRCNEPLDIYMDTVHFTASTCRCSGDPQTSLGNSLTNLASILAAYMYATDGDDPAHVVAWVEGDDSLVLNPFNEEQLRKYREGFVAMGFSAKMELVDFVGDAGYCSQFFDELGNNCPRIAQTFLEFPWNHNGCLSMGSELLSLKALSLDCSARGQPLAWALSRKYAPRTRAAIRLPYNAYEAEEYQREGFNVCVTSDHMIVYLDSLRCGHEPNDAQREIFAAKYGITAAKQRKIERKILKYGVNGLPLRHLRRLCETDGIDYDACCRFYHDNIDRVQETNGRRFTSVLKRGKDGRKDVRQKFVTPLPASPAPLSPATEGIIDPYKAAMIKHRQFKRRVRTLMSTNMTYRAIVQKPGIDALIKAIVWFVIIMLFSVLSGSTLLGLRKLYSLLVAMYREIALSE